MQKKVFDQHLTNILIHSSYKEKKEIEKDIRKIHLKAPALSYIQIANCMEMATRRGADKDDLPQLLLISGQMSFGFQRDYVEAMELIHKMRNYFGRSPSYQEVGDGLAVVFKKGIDLNEFVIFFDTYSKEVPINRLKFNEFLAAAITLSKGELRGEEAGLDLGALVNELHDPKVQMKLSKLLSKKSK